MDNSIALDLDEMFSELISFREIPHLSISNKESPTNPQRKITANDRSATRTLG